MNRERQLRRASAAPASASPSREETELTEKVHLVEEQVLGLQRVAVGGIDSRPPELNGSSVGATSPSGVWSTPSWVPAKVPSAAAAGPSVRSCLI